MASVPGNGIVSIFKDICDELARAQAKHGSQSLPLGTRSGGMNLVWRTQTQNACDRATREGSLTWSHIILEEVAEAECEEDEVAWEKEALQAASMYVKAIADIREKRAAKAAPMTPCNTAAPAPVPAQPSKIAGDPYGPQHFRALCGCGAVLAQCRCPGPKIDRIVSQICETCKAKG